MEKLRFLSPSQVRAAAKEFGTPIFIYSRKELEKRCEYALNFPNAFGLTVRYAMKANPNSTILRIMKEKGLHIDASSEFEAYRAIRAGFLPSEIMLTSQEEARNLKDLVRRGVLFNACSLKQLKSFGELFPGKEVCIRINPGLGSGSSKKTDVGGTTSSFGIWHEQIEEVKKIVKDYNLIIYKIHTHIGSGSDPEVWKAVARYTLEYAEMFSECRIVNLGGGYKVGRMQEEVSTDFQVIGKPVKELFEEFFQKHGRKLHLEIEPGTSLVANMGSILSTVNDVVHTGANGFRFVKLDTGMDTNTRPSLYGSRHPIITIPIKEEERKSENYVVVGHCCESGDVFTQAFGGEPETRELLETKVGDFVIMEGCGAYCAAMSTKNYNSHPEAAEVLLDNDGKFKLIRKRQSLEQIYQNELDVEI
ncbi:MAG: diaminopimelate decarboxylase [Leptospiraceae bacterium]|nr:diaminopimelate decarboxylase [Leptospiraceae bacterium]MCP5501675.1 diaminopimelate decarboxylase [Leptospiraceae bacterium]